MSSKVAPSVIKLRKKQDSKRQRKGDLAPNPEIWAALKEGVLLNEILEDFYTAEPSRFRAVGQQSGKIISVGDGLTVEVKAADINRRTIDLNFISKDD